jgi:hypothetical protein
MRNRSIIIEGVDNSGKTTIAKALARQLGMQYFKHTSQTRNFKDARFYDTAYVEAFYLIDMLKQLSFDGGIIFDRHIPSEFAYGLTYDRQVNHRDIELIDFELSKLGTVCIFCEKNYDKPFEDEVIDFDKVELLRSNFHKFFEQSAMRTLYLDTTAENLEDQLIQINRFLVEHYMDMNKGE